MPPPSVGRVKSGALSPISRLMDGFSFSSLVACAAGGLDGRVVVEPQDTLGARIHIRLKAGEVNRAGARGQNGLERGRPPASSNGSSTVSFRTPCTLRHSASAAIERPPRPGAATRRSRQAPAVPRACSGRSTPGRARRFAQLQILRDEFDIDHAAAAVLDLESGRLAVLLGDARAHVGDVDDQAVGFARPGQHVAHLAVTRSASAAGPATTRARVSAMCSQVQAISR